MGIFDFTGYTFAAEKINAIGKIRAIDTKAMEWNFGFTVFIGGSECNILCPKPEKYGTPEGPSEDEYKSMAAELRGSFVEKWLESERECVTS